MKRRGHRVFSNCPLCNRPDEHITHMLSCPSASQFRSNFLSQLNTWLTSNNTHPSITSFITQGLQRWFHRPSSNIAFYSSEDTINKGYHSQSTLGWFPLLCGYLAQDLIVAQQHYYLEIQSRRSANRWGSNLIKQVWNIVYQLWWHRNSALHKSDKIHLLSGKQLLKEAISTELVRGPLDLHPVYRRYFTHPSVILLKKSTPYLKRWFLVVRSGREALDHGQYNNQWSRDNVLRRWVGLPPKD